MIKIKNLWRKILKIPPRNSWRRILQKIFDALPLMYGENNELPFSNDNHPLAKDLKITGGKLQEGIKVLRDQGLIENKMIVGGPPGHYIVSLPEKGFNIALDLEKYRASSKLQFLIIIFTAMIVFTGAMQFIKEVAKTDPKTGLIIYGGVIFVLGVIGITRSYL